MIDEELLEASPYRKQILAVLGVIYENTSRQAKLLKKLELVREFKAVVLSNYHIVEESFSARLFNKSLYNLAVQGESLTEAELHKYGVFQSIAKFMGAEQSQVLIQKLKTVLERINTRPQVKPIQACDCWLLNKIIKFYFYLFISMKRPNSAVYLSIPYNFSTKEEAL